MKYSRSSIGLEVIQEVERKVRVLEQLSKKTIQKVLITNSSVTKDLANGGYFYRIISAEEFF
jgi:hypothetical protein